MSRPQIALIVAATTGKLVIGNGPDLPWPRLREDLKNFKRLTVPHPIIVGRKTFETFRDKEGNQIVLPERVNIVVTRNPGYANESHPEAWVAQSLDSAIEMARMANEATDATSQKIWICGGSEIYREALGYLPDGSHDPKKCIVDEIWMTEIDADFEGDVMFPGIPKGLFTGGPEAPQEFRQSVKDGPDIVYRITHCVRI